MGLLSSWALSTIAHHGVTKYCAFLCKERQYKYLILGDDSLDTSLQVYNKRLEVMKGLGVTINLSKCTQSESGFAEFAKRLFNSQGEVTGIPVPLLEGISRKPEQLIELIRLARERGYQDTDITPGIRFILSRMPKKISDLATSILQLPERITSSLPLGIRKGQDTTPLCGLLEDQLDVLKTLCLNRSFWDEVGSLVLPNLIPDTVNRPTISEDHPIVFGISQKAMLYLEHDPSGSDEYSIYNGWMDGNFREMVHVPSVNPYRTMNKGHKITKCK